ncbi:hypothetical protein [Sediminicoccus sp. KRV36]|uniref:hypothetical protein n=1 Tax=Sediminicoccus sp. KRV36 TaxID=3133721 RepID=UPI00200C757C|nr:hypothetical protein [Sediminicoccus rosea]UPY36207.1 hypothetical protein LHU95_18605 [Sediminicoccus rosea]
MARPDPIPELIRDFICRQPQTWSYSQLAEACRKTFGREAPDAEAIRTWWLARGKRPDPRARILNDPEVAAFIRDYAGRLSPPLILGKLRATFPAARVPARSSLYRHISAVLSDDALNDR